MKKTASKKPSKKTEAKPAPEAAKPAEKLAAGKPEKTPAKAEKSEPKKVDLGKDSVKKAIAAGQAIIKEGKSKADAARAMYALLKKEDKEMIVAAFVEGATLTEKGVLTYWYNCKRKAEKEDKKAA